jgi:ankyrin repeat protein
VAADNALETAKILVAAGLNVNEKNNNGESPLHRAAMTGIPELIEFLIQRGASVNARDNWGGTPLKYVGNRVSTGSNARAIEILRKHGGTD